MNTKEAIVLIGLLAIFVCLYRYIRNKPLMPNFLKKLDLRQLDTKIIIAIIIGLSAIACTYLYTQNTQLDQCIKAMQGRQNSKDQATIQCIALINSHR